MTGKRCGRLMIISRHGARKGSAVWICECDCGNACKVSGFALRKGLIVSCGCYIREKSTRHGMHGTPTYGTWQAMMRRCHNPNAPTYKKYGLRGISVCSRWRESFGNFLADMGERPIGMTIDRINGAGNYEPGNCRWATCVQQSRNRSFVRLTLDLAREIHGRHEHGESMRSIARRLQIGATTVGKVINGVTWHDVHEETIQPREAYAS